MPHRSIHLSDNVNISDISQMYKVIRHKMKQGDHISNDVIKKFNRLVDRFAKTATNADTIQKAFKMKHEIKNKIKKHKHRSLSMHGRFGESTGLALQSRHKFGYGFGGSTGITVPSRYRFGSNSTESLGISVPSRYSKFGTCGGTMSRYKFGACGGGGGSYTPVRFGCGCGNTW